MASGTAYPQNSNPLGLGGIGGLIPNLFQSANYRPDTATKYGLTMPGLDRLEDGNPIRSIMPYLPVEGPEGRPYRPGTNPMPDIGGGGIGSITNPTNYDDKFSGYDTKIGGFDNQFKDIIGRLDKLEQGIGGVSSQPKSSPLDGGVFSVYQGNNSRGY